MKARSVRQRQANAVDCRTIPRRRGCLTAAPSRPVRASAASLRRIGAIDDPLTEILPAGARWLIAQAVEAEFETILASDGVQAHDGGLEDRAAVEGR